MEILFKKVVGLVNYYVLVNCYALGPTGQYSVLIFRIPTVFDIIRLELATCSVGWFVSLLVRLCEREVLLAGSLKQCLCEGAGQPASPKRTR